jgi:hypothetical protein
MSTARSRILFALAFLAALVGVGALAQHLARRARPDQPVELVAPSRPAQAGPSDRSVLPVPLYKQWDRRWADHPLGRTSEKMRNVGCTVSCVAMVFSGWGLEVTPGELNAWLRDHDGYTERGWLRWDKCAEYSGGRFVLDYFGEADGALIERALAAGRPPIIKVILPSGAPHWVVVVGREGGEYLVNDPLDDSTGPVSLERLGGRAWALRVFRKR